MLSRSTSAICLEVDNLPDVHQEDCKCSFDFQLFALLFLIYRSLKPDATAKKIEKYFLTDKMKAQVSQDA